MQIGKEGWILRVDFDDTHRHNHHVIVLSLNGPGHTDTFPYLMVCEFCRRQADMSLGSALESERCQDIR